MQNYFKIGLFTYFVNKPNCTGTDKVSVIKQ